ncbi:hypothetical protein Ae406Ps2_5569 [Pseudonocardia sp. Ae406_Ps2]|nr:hypothetical protein Ae331Ps2_0387c [Pseudonocardia sp. Ae331_Ps2]OLM05569.1 hypothetical protein Ae406Ps2_5569 [Pseudonocardia sp. Ae406_Ps2]OLM15483.1 hypothetical protein Ae505Ps2_5615c [Pseudonocardia sp. Ae505_Ps2]OLM27140.1 hypothetical protein Ae706Ps2_5574 [Pseudonocardia sp. Ae706_Ps2]
MGCQPVPDDVDAARLPVVGVAGPAALRGQGFSLPDSVGGRDRPALSYPPPACGATSPAGLGSRGRGSVHRACSGAVPKLVVHEVGLLPRG